MTSNRADVQDIVERLQKREHYFRHASEGEYDANLLMNARFEIERLRAALQQSLSAVEALEASKVAIDDWLHTYAHDLCDKDQVAESRQRILSAGGTLSYIAHLQEANRAALLQESAG